MLLLEQFNPDFLLIWQVPVSGHLDPRRRGKEGKEEREKGLLPLCLHYSDGQQFK